MPGNRSRGRVDHDYVTRNFRQRRPPKLSIGEKISNVKLGEVANYAAAAASWAVSKLNTELHVVDNTATLSPVTTSWQTVACISDVTGGDDTNLRTGNEIKAEFLEFKGVVTQPPADTTPAATRILIVQDKGSPAGSAPAAGTIMQATGNLGSSINYDEVDRFVILDDFLLQTAPGPSGQQAPFMRNVPLRLKHMFFQSQSSGTFDQGAVYVLAVCNYGTSGTCNPVLNAVGRLGFYDN